MDPATRSSVWSCITRSSVSRTKQSERLSDLRLSVYVVEERCDSEAHSGKLAACEHCCSCCS
uniref:Uncharacterized protein n=1 Tax=Hyaloperonospora arabidopsidis (strain Emoy2) TaxID=559515 RepID=M4C242_HYAAE